MTWYLHFLINMYSRIVQPLEDTHNTLNSMLMYLPSVVVLSNTTVS